MKADKDKKRENTGKNWKIGHNTVKEWHLDIRESYQAEYCIGTNSLIKRRRQGELMGDNRHVKDRVITRKIHQGKYDANIAKYKKQTKHNNLKPYTNT